MIANPYRASLPDKNPLQEALREQHAGVVTRCLQLGLSLAAGTCLVATLWLLVKVHRTTAPGEANVGAGLALLAIPPSILALGISLATWRATTRYGRTALMLLAAILLVPSLLLFLLIEL